MVVLEEKQVTGQNFPGSACDHDGHVRGASTVEVSRTRRAQSPNW